MDRSRVATDTNGLFLGDLEPGARVGDYTIEATIAARGTGVLYRATHLLLPRRVTIKIMPAVHAWTRSLAIQLLREACIVEALDHPGIARIYECGVLADRRPWVASELVEGQTLADAIDRAPMTALEVTCLIRDIAEILEHAHRRGVVHCNLNPAAIVINARKNARFPVTVNDWASARTFDSTTPAPLPSPARLHQSPEQRAGGTIDERTDIYALGVIAYRGLSGVYPEAGMVPAIEGVPPVLTSMVALMLAKESAKRPSAEEVHTSAAVIASTMQRGAEEGDPTTPRERAETDIEAFIETALEEVVDDPSNGVPEPIGPVR